jgi:UDP-N-acetylglucosamine--N-acetylmuramyl-(pentapeptide) pyrophosphoryl-undecaprenol N-acetylglucosamine transferase
MPQAYAAADVVLARAGASTVAELTAVGVPSILVPWPGAADDHQTANASPLAEAGAALLLPESDLSVARLQREIDRLESHPEELVGMAAAARALGAVHRSDALVRLVEEVAQA